MARQTKGQREYMERLQDPRWQRKRLGVLERAGWKCQWCGTDKVNLQIHHSYYTRGAMPWEYPDEALYCLCDDCHERAEAWKAEGYRELGLIPPWYQAHAVQLLRELQALLADGASPEQLDALAVERGA